MAQLSWNDIFDFSSLDEPSSSPPPAPDAAHRDICTDFACCGLALPDLHALVDHFEEHHVLVLGHDGRPASTPLILSYPQPDPPAEPSALLGRSSPFAHGRLHRDGPEHDFSDGTSDSASYSSGSAFSSPNPSEPVCLPPSLLTVQPPLPPDVLPASPPAPAKQKVSSAKTQLLGAHRSLSRKPSLPPLDAQRKRRSREREKAYKCPRPGCSKAYLNPNGLKYHLEKGTCTIVAPEPPVDNAHQT